MLSEIITIQPVFYGVAGSLVVTGSLIVFVRYAFIGGINFFADRAKKRDLRIQANEAADHEYREETSRRERAKLAELLPGQWIDAYYEGKTIDHWRVREAWLKAWLAQQTSLPGLSMVGIEKFASMIVGDWGSNFKEILEQLTVYYQIDPPKNDIITNHPEPKQEKEPEKRRCVRCNNPGGSPRKLNGIYYGFRCDECYAVVRQNPENHGCQCEICCKRRERIKRRVRRGR